MTTRSRLPLAAALLAALLAAGAIGWALRGPGKQPAPNPPAGLLAQPTRLDHGVPVGWPHTQQGAVAAVAAYGEALNDPRVLFSRDRRSAVVKAIGTPRYIRTFQGSGGRALDELSRTNAIAQGIAQGAQTVFFGVPLSYRVNSYTPARAVITNWSVGVVGNDTGSAPTATWQTTTTAVVWSDGDWKVDVVDSSSEGPTPRLESPETPQRVLSTVADMKGFRHVP